MSFVKKPNQHHHHQRRRKVNPNELFVGNLSFFCKEEHLFEKFSSTAAMLHGLEPGVVLERFDTYVSAVRIIYSDGQPHRSLMFGFVTMVDLEDAHLILQQLQGVMFMGRRLK
jgi:RNA recognition motif-containing protein